QLVEYLPGEPMLGLARPRSATNIVFAHLPAGGRAGLHPSPRAQSTVILAGCTCRATRRVRDMNPVPWVRTSACWQSSHSPTGREALEADRPASLPIR